MSEQTYKADSSRMDLPETGMYIRAQNEAGSYGAFDLSHLDRDSVVRWLRSRGGENLWAENTVLILLGHKTVEYAVSETASEVSK